MARITPAHRMPMPMGGPWKNAPMKRNAAEHGAQRLFEPGREDRREHQQAPHTVDDRRDRSQQLDGNAERPAQPRGRQFSEEQCDAEADRHRDNESNDRRGDRAVDRHQRAEFLAGWIPVGGPQEAQTELLDRRQRGDDQRNDDAAEQQERDDRGEARETAENNIAGATGRFLLRRAAGRARHEGDVGHGNLCTCDHMLHDTTPCNQYYSRPASHEAGRLVATPRERLLGD